MNFTDPIITRAERYGSPDEPYERPEETDEDLMQCERIANRKAAAFCNACEGKTADEQRVEFMFALVKYTRVIYCWLCKKF